MLINLTVGKTAWALLGGPRVAAFLEKPNLELRFKRKSLFGLRMLTELVVFQLQNSRS